jgi:adenine-specific DNA-methyltransferase
MTRAPETDWDLRLGLTPTSLFGARPELETGSHYALLDGVNGSFLLSLISNDRSVEDLAPSWAWSCDLRHHVTVTGSEVVLRRVAQNARSERFSQGSVESKLDSFFEFLLRDQSNPTVTAVEHVVSLFRRHQEEFYAKKLSQERHLASFLLLMANVLETQQSSNLAEHPDKLAKKYDVDLNHLDHASLQADYLRRFRQEVAYSGLAHRSLNLGMTIRHAGGALFQEAHAVASSAPAQLAFFGLAEARSASLDLSQGVYYTPPGLARSLVELSLRPLLAQDSIRVLDPACGSGMFLCETVRFLQREGFEGSISLTGRDISPAAIQMAQFALACAMKDWPGHAIETDIKVQDFIQQPVGGRHFDAVLMNPPFRGWLAMTAEERAVIKKELGDLYQNRPDLSVVFVTRALGLLRSGGTLATLLPVGALLSDSTTRWRESLMEQASLEFLSVLGDHALFRYATVNIAALVLTKGEADRNGPVTMLWASEQEDAAAAALRALRKHRAGARLEQRTGEWSLYTVSGKSLGARRNWLPRPNALGSLLDEIRKTTPSSVGALFHVRQGIRTGLREAFILSKERFLSLPKGERIYFKPIAENDSIRNGEVTPVNYLFYAPGRFKTERELKDECTEYFQEYILPKRAQLRGRAGVDPEVYWEMARPRTGLGDGHPRIVAKRFATTNGFALDAKGRFAIVQGNVWLPRWDQFAGRPEAASRAELLGAYVDILNSDIFYLLAREFSPNVAGGQVELAGKFVGEVPLPDLTQETAHAQWRRVKVGKDEDGRYEWAERNRVAASAYGTPLSAWPVTDGK